MGILGFNFSKFDCERKAPKKGGQIQVHFGIAVKDVKKVPLKVGASSNTDVLKVDFAFDVSYSEGLGKISIAGDVVFSDTKEIIEETLKSWQADKKLNKVVNEEVLSFVYNKAIVKAFEIADDLNLPSPMPLPKLSFGEKKQTK
jgi:hypothetical protein